MKFFFFFNILSALSLFEIFIEMLEVVPQISESLFFCFSLLGLIICIYLSSHLLILFSAISDLLLSPSSEFFISIIVLFIYRVFIRLCYSFGFSVEIAYLLNHCPISFNFENMVSLHFFGHVFNSHFGVFAKPNIWAHSESVSHDFFFA